MKLLDLTGEPFGRWIVIERAENTEGGQAQWLCRCECGNEKVLTGHVIRNVSRSCGCLRSEVTAKRSTKHGHATGGVISPTYYSWQGMWDRCTNENSYSYDLYGGRGIRVDKWWTPFEYFLADMGEKPEGKSLDRIDVDGNYTKKNCRWATPKEQANNKTCNRLITFEGETLTLMQWAERLDLHSSTLAERLDNWSLEDALTIRPLTKKERASGIKRLIKRGVNLQR